MTAHVSEISLQLDTIRDCIAAALENASAIAKEAFAEGEVAPQKKAQALLFSLRSMQTQALGARVCLDAVAKLREPKS